MQMDLHVQPTGKSTAYTVFTQAQVDAIRGEPGRSRVNIVLGYGGETFRTSIARYRGEWMFVVNKRMRDAGLVPTGTYSVTLSRDLEPRRADAAPDVLAALASNPAAQGAWEALSTSRKREHLRHIEGAKRAETRARRIQKLVDTLEPT